MSQWTSDILVNKVRCNNKPKKILFLIPDFGTVRLIIRSVILPSTWYTVKSLAFLRIPLWMFEEKKFHRLSVITINRLWQLNGSFSSNLYLKNASISSTLKSILLVLIGENLKWLRTISACHEFETAYKLLRWEGNKIVGTNIMTARLGTRPKLSFSIICVTGLVFTIKIPTFYFWVLLKAKQGCHGGKAATFSCVLIRTCCVRQSMFM